MYLTNEGTGQTAVFNNPQIGWRDATQQEIDDYLLVQAKNDKILELKGDLNDFMVAGYEDTGDIVCAAWDSGTTYALHDLVLATDTKNYRSIQADNLNHEPPDVTWWEEFNPVFKFDNCSMINLTAKCDLDAGATDRYKFYDKGYDDGFRNQINFGDSTKWDAFAEALRVEEDRVMRKYNDYRSQIAQCSTTAQVEAISIDFSV